MKFFITTPIFYVNSGPHLGHLYSAVLADAAARFASIHGGCISILSTGTDEHGQKVRQASVSAGESPSTLCQRVSAQYRAAFDSADIQYSKYVRTTDADHIKAVQHFWRLLESRGHVQKGSYKGWYSIPDESFLTASQVKEEVRNGKSVMLSSESGHEVTWAEEDNYVFPMSAVQDDLRHWLRNHLHVQPAKFGRILESWLDSDLPDLSISRPVSRLDWGIPVPGDDQQVVYVWLDALVNYLTASGYPGPLDHWPPDCHVIGKDILKFHGVYWPALLLATGLPLPRRILCHSHWTVDGVKMSKSLGNVVSAEEALQTYSADGLRYFLLREGVPHSDGNFSRRKAAQLLNAELADTLGNLLGRCCGAAVNPTQRRYPVPPHVGETEERLLRAAAELPGIVADAYEQFCFYQGLEAAMALLRNTNQFVQMREPWVLRKDPRRAEELRCCLAVAMEMLRVAGVLLQPVVPALAGRLLDKLAVPAAERRWRHAEQRYQLPLSGDAAGVELGTGSAVLFRKLR